ncbi:integrase [Bradyrhizobium sp. AZCC 2262]
MEDAGLGDDVVRHSLRHTAATWMMQEGTDRWQAAGWLGMTLEQLENGYGHHHPLRAEPSVSARGMILNCLAGPIDCAFHCAVNR